MMADGTSRTAIISPQIISALSFSFLFSFDDRRIYILWKIGEKKKNADFLRIVILIKQTTNKQAGIIG